MTGRMAYAQGLDPRLANPFDPHAENHAWNHWDNEYLAAANFHRHFLGLKPVESMSNLTAMIDGLL